MEWNDLGMEQMRTIFSCMWPSCPGTCDSLDDIERHVRAHLGPNSIGDEDFYYEETEVDEPTYLAIFGHASQQQQQMQLQLQQQQLELELQLADRRLNLTHHHHHNHRHHRRHSHTNNNHHHQALPLSPSHNSDGLSSGHSFASSSPATSPVCSADSSSASSSSALSTSSLSSSASSANGFHLDQPLAAPLGGVCGGSGNGGLAHGAKMQGSVVAGVPSGGQFASSANNSLDWSHFLTSSPRVNWARQSSAQQQQQQLSKRHQKQQMRFQHNLQSQQQQQLYFNANANSKGHMFSLEAMLPTGKGGSCSRRHQAANAKGASFKQQQTIGHHHQAPQLGRGRKRAQQKLQEQLRASIIEQLNQQRSASSSIIGGPQQAANKQQQHHHNLQFSMQLTGSSPASNKQQSRHLELDHSYEEQLSRGGASGGESNNPSASNSSSSLATQIKARRGRRPSAKLLAGQESGEGRRATGSSGNTSASATASATAPKRRGRRPQIFQQQNPHSQASRASFSGSPPATATAVAAANNSRLISYQSCHQRHAMAPTPPLSSATTTPSGGEDEEEQDDDDDDDEEEEELLEGDTGNTNTAMVGPLSSGNSATRRARNENRKCRKVYGMEAREQWCIQCKWKKACSRFCDQLQ